MATAFLARPARLRSSAGRLAGALLLAGSAWLSGCAGASKPRLLAAQNAGLRLQNGVLLYHDAPFSGTTYEVGARGDTLATTPYRQGQPHGLARAWYGPRRPREQRRYVAGREEGLAQGWWADGRPHFQRWFRAGQYHGSVQEWYPNGQLYRRGHYAAGQEAGPQQLWQPDGTLRANYEARNGRQYGFIGSKHCATPLL